MSIDFKKMKELTTELTSKLEALKKKVATEHLSSSDHSELDFAIRRLTSFWAWPFGDSEVVEGDIHLGEFRDFKGNYTYLRLQALQDPVLKLAKKGSSAPMKEAEQLLKDHPIKYTAEEVETQKREAEFMLQDTQYNTLMRDFRQFKTLVAMCLSAPQLMDEKQRIILQAKRKFELYVTSFSVPHIWAEGACAEIDKYFKQYNLENPKPSNQSAAITPMYQANVAVANVENPPVVPAPIPAQIDAVRNAAAPH
jgi:hypothetical protein